MTISLSLWLYLLLLVVACLLGVAIMEARHRRQRRHLGRRGWHEDDERGAVLILAALSVAAGLLLTLYVVIAPGALYVARAQAQTAADGGALAGAISLRGVDEADDPGAVQAEAIEAARVFAAANPIWGAPPDTIDPTLETTLGECPLTAGGYPSCVRVWVYRDLRVALADLRAGATAVGQARAADVRLVR